MNYGVVFYVLGWILKAEAIFLLFPFSVDLIYKEHCGMWYLITAVICMILGTLMSRKKPKNGGLYLKEGYFVVALGWITMSVVGAVPLRMTGEIPYYLDAVFETVSGFTTTGATILSDVEALSHSALFWRSFMHLLGGMGVFVFLSGLLPMLGGNSANLMKAESPGPSVDKLVPRIKDTVKILYAIYLSLGLLEVIFLLIFGVNLFESLTLTFGTIGTGGFGTLNSSIASYSPAVQWTIAIFMLLSGANYALYFLLIMRQFRKALTMEEIRLYLIIQFVATGLIVANLAKFYSTMEETIRHSFFNVASLLTSTGFATTDYNLWPEFSRMVLILVMMVGACAGSTGGGIKVGRVLILAKAIRKQVQMFIHPRTIKKIIIDKTAVDHDAIRATNAYIVALYGIMFLSVLFVSLDGYDLTTNFSAVLASLNNIGPGLNLVGPVSNYGFFSDISKLVLIFAMLAGRLEIFPMLLLITPSSWRRQ